MEKHCPNCEKDVLAVETERPVQQGYTIVRHAKVLECPICGRFLGYRD